MKIFIVLLIAFSAGCSTTGHLSTSLTLNQGVNSRQRAQYVARLQTALLKFVSSETPDVEHNSYLLQSSVQWIPIGTNGWLVVAERNHHADHFHLSERDWFGAVSVALDSDGRFYYSLRDICGYERFSGQKYSTTLDFLKATLRRGWDWRPLPSPRQLTQTDDFPTEHELTEMADRYRKRLEDKGVDIAMLKVFPDRSVYIRATPKHGDLKPFLEMPVEFLSVVAGEITDLSPLLVLNPRILELHNYLGSDLALLSRTEINELLLWGCKNIDFSTLLGVETIRHLICYPFYESPSFELLRQSGNLESIQSKSPTVFWNEWDNGAYKTPDKQETDEDDNIEIIVI
jgi:hypothetical protein